MRADQSEFKRMGEGGEPPSSLEARAGAFLHEARPTLGLHEPEIRAIEGQLLQRGRVRHRLRLLPVFVAFAVLLIASSVMAVVVGWRPWVPFLGGADETLDKPRTASTKPRAKMHPASPSVTVKSEPSIPETVPAPNTQPTQRRIARAEHSRPAESPPLPPPEGALSVEARSLADALSRWRRDGKAEEALALLGAHDRRFPHRALWVESRVARAEILLALARREQALSVLDSLTLKNLPRARELQTLRGELRAVAGRCQDARTDLSPVLSITANDDLSRRAARALAACP
jgi:hypothetical protein